MAGNTISAASNEVTLAAPEGVTVASVTLYKASAATTAVPLTEGNHYTIAHGKITVPDNYLTAWGAGSKFTIKFSDNHTEDITIQ